MTHADLAWNRRSERRPYRVSFVGVYCGGATRRDIYNI